MNRTARHVIFGTGAIGLATLQALLRRGKRCGWSTAPAPPPYPTKSKSSG